MIFKALALVLALLGYYFSPYGPVSAEPPTNAGSDRAMRGDVYRGKVIRVADGDTVTVKTDNGATHKIRLHAVDAPELNQAGGEQSRRWLSQTVMNQAVKVLVSNTDRYKRHVAKLVLPGPACEAAVCEGDVDVNLAAVESGHAWWYREFARTQSPSDRALYEQAEQQARTNRMGLWQAPNPQAPWQWRADQRKRP
jgi:endonuclease YncB( thermonuclease family)